MFAYPLMSETGFWGASAVASGWANPEGAAQNWEELIFSAVTKTAKVRLRPSAWSHVRIAPPVTLTREPNETFVAWFLAPFLVWAFRERGRLDRPKKFEPTN